MKTSFKSMVSNLPKQVKSSRLHVRFFPAMALLMALLLILLSSCGKDNAPEGNTDNHTLGCKNRPGRISFGRDTIDIKYNAQDKPITITTIVYNDPLGPSQLPVNTVYTIAYNVAGKADKVSRSVSNQLEWYCQMQYNSNGQLIKQSRFNAQGTLTASTVAEYDNSNMLAKIITHTEGSSADVTSVYNYANGNLITKSIQNLYDDESQVFYSSDYTYTYFTDKENKITSYFDGPLGLLFISTLSDKPSLQYHPDKADYQLFFAQETSAEKKMLKSTEIIAHRFGTNDTTKIDYSYQYDVDGFPSVQKGTYQNIKRRYVPTPFGGLVLLVTPFNSTYERTMNYYCN
ncbi:MAG: hypothetical protein ABI091_25400 [Ferruginibacter sp.]